MSGFKKGTPEYDAWKNSPAYEEWVKNQHRKIWTEEEVCILRENYSTCTAKALRTLLPGRSEGAIRHKINELGLLKREPRDPNAPKGEFVSLWEKRCTRCGKIKTLDNFRYEKRHGKRTYSCACIECDRAIQRERARRRHPSHQRELPPGQRYCSVCATIKPIEQFIKSKTRKSGHGHWCKDCSKQYKKVTSSGRQQPNLLTTTRKLALKRYGITLDQYDAMLLAQNGVCAICYKPETVINAKTGKVSSLGVDHDHRTGKVRALLCKNCNQSLGLLNEDTIVIMAAVSYLQGNPVPATSLLLHEVLYGAYHAQNLKSTYGMTIEEYKDRLRQQNNACAICHKAGLTTKSGKYRPLCVDHDHKTGKIRGLLCQKCNHALGLLNDDPVRIESLLNYARTHQDILSPSSGIA